MNKYEILEHRADLKIRAFGKTKEELFLNMMLGMQSALRTKIKNPLPTLPTGQAGGRQEKSKVKSIKIKSLDFPALLVDFLSQVLYHNQINKETYSAVNFPKLSDNELEAELSGQKIESFGEDIKAVTYHDLDVRQKQDGIWEAIVLFDI